MKNNPEESALQGLMQIIRRRKLTVCVVWALCLAFAVSCCILSTRRYMASSTIELDRTSNDGLGLASLMGGFNSDASDSMGENLDIETQVNILRSDKLALKVIRDLNLADTSDFSPRRGVLDTVAAIFGAKVVSKRAASASEMSPAVRDRLVAVFRRNLRVKPIAGSRLIEVSYRDPNPQTAAAVANGLIRELVDYSFQTRYKATTDTSKWLEVQLDDLRNQTRDLQGRLVSMQKDTDLFGFGTGDGVGKTTIYSPILDRLQEATKNLEQAHADTIVKGAVYEAAKNGGAELISQLTGPAGNGITSPGIANSFALIQNLRGQEATLHAQLDQDSEKFGDAYPKLIEEKAGLARIQQEIQDEIRRVSARARTDYEIASQTEEGARKTYESSRQLAERLNDKTIELTILQRETDQSQELYDDLLKRLKEAGIIDSLHSSNLTVVEEALTPSQPSSPNIRNFLLGGTLLGLVLGCGAALTLDSVDSRLIGAEDVENLGLALLGVLPRAAAKEMRCGAPMIEHRGSRYSEAMRKLRSRLLLSRSGLPPQVILVTSGNPGEGKTTLAVNLALALTQRGERVLMVETDMRNPSVQERFHIQTSKGLSEMLATRVEDPMEAELPSLADVRVLEAGPIPPYPSELLGSDTFERLMSLWKERFDFVVLDSSPVLPVADTQLLAGYADAIIIVARSGMTTRNALRHTYEEIRPHAKDQAAPAIGVVLNAAPLDAIGYYQYSGKPASIYLPRG